LRADDEIVLGPATLARLHKHVGDTVTMSYGSPADAPVYVPPTPLKIVGTATFPTVGATSIYGDNPSMGDGALISSGVEPPAFKQAFVHDDPNLDGPSFVVVAMRPGLSRQTADADIQRIKEASDAMFAADPNSASSQLIPITAVRPAEIANYHNLGTVPELLAASLLIAATVAFALTLMAAVRQHRRDLAILKALGFTRGRIGATIASQATLSAIIGVAIGLPIGALAGRWLWARFARSIYAVPHPTLAPGWILLVGIATVAIANIAAAVPARVAAQLPTAQALRAE
jgi:hypothetical protein